MTQEPGQVLEIVEELYNEFPGEYLRAACRTEIEERDEIGSLVYGEVGFTSLAWILRTAMSHCGVEDGPPSVFYDLGSGSGRMVVSAALLYPELKRCGGIEIIRGLHDVAQLVKSKMEQAGEDSACFSRSKCIDFSHGDLLEAEWSDADIVLVNSTCFTAKLMADLEAKAAGKLRQGAVIITFTSHFKGPEWELVCSNRRQMSWGPADIYLQRKLPANE
eukprot:CAMPEP_0117680238 /NCGR_PEP_ID=MMETSP0804-20121206/18241_1 /TAXON_ID=1074897 /ORGANISM="Tetraselmis astigmatica, Strain CCMP880" /LENGTH=218 /DNA_ID=CAMNT_0005489713 /DNA_START=292 /DNA_END=949 /DNA_ORIENTATION=+